MLAGTPTPFSVVFVCGALLGTANLRAQICELSPDGSACVPLACSPIPEDQCIATVLYLDRTTGAITPIACECMDLNACHVELGNVTPFPVGLCPDGESCTVLGSDFDGDGVDDLFTAHCLPFVPGVCCLDSDGGPIFYDTCVPLDEKSCGAEGGIFSGVDIVCRDAQACCLPFGTPSTCVDMSPLCCSASFGIPQGPGSTCAESNDPGGCGQTCGGFAWIDCEDPAQFCKLPRGGCCCDFMGICTPVPSGCPDFLDPVCGCDGVTYTNECEADAGGVSVDHHGPCEQPCLMNEDCPALTQFCKFPEGACEPLGTAGACTSRPEHCPLFWDPVCGCDGVTYGNDCEADRAGVSIRHRGACKENACCFADGSCLDLPADVCKGAGGTPLPGAPCSKVDCKIAATGACCIHDSTGVVACFVGTEADCIREGGTYGGDGTTCLFDLDACVLRPDPGFCLAICPRFFYNTCSGQCESFMYGCCAGNANNFLTLEDCEAGCMLDDHVCLLPPETGDCLAAIPRFFYNACSGQCELFSYGGCGGNANNFETLEQCAHACPTPGTGACGPLAGACCLDDPLAASCFVTEEVECRNKGGAYQGDGTRCPPDSTVPCGPLAGACCFDIGGIPTPLLICEEATQTVCESGKGIFEGPGTICDVTEACCLPYGEDYCADIGPRCCAAYGGFSYGPGSNCADVSGQGICGRVCGGVTLELQCVDGYFCKFPEGVCSPAVNGGGVCRPIPNKCPEVYDPVCGCDGVTYANECFADAASISVLHHGECEAVCKPNDAGTDCAQACPSAIPEVGCWSTVLHLDANSNAMRVAACDCFDFNVCHIELTNTGPVPVGFCSDGGVCRIVGTDTDGDGKNDTFKAQCVPEPRGACCVDIDDGPIGHDTCLELPHTLCEATGGLFHGAGTTCMALEACCVGDYCGQNDPTCCVDAGGVPQGRGSTCDAVVGGSTCKRVCGGFTGDRCEAGEFCKFPEGICSDAVDHTGFCAPIPDECPEIYDPVCGCDGLTYDNECFSDAAGVSVLHSGECGRPCDGLGPHPPCDEGQFCRHELGQCSPANKGICTSTGDGGCLANVDPVCGCNGVTYVNDCKAGVAGASIAHWGECKWVCCDPKTAPPCIEETFCCADGNWSCGDGGGGTTCDKSGVVCGPVCGGVKGLPCYDQNTFCKFPQGTCGMFDIFGMCTPGTDGCLKTLYDPVCGCDGVTYGNECEADAAGVSIEHRGECIPTCEPTDDGSACTHPVCSPVLETDCFSTVLHLDPVTGEIAVVACECMHIFGPCYVAIENGVPVAVGTCLEGEACELITSDTNRDGIDDTFMAKCVPTGACCEDITDGLIPYESCSDASRDSCATAGGIFHGANTSCSKVQACCLGDGLCHDMNALCCIDSGGVPGGHGTTCTDIGGCERICGGIAGILCREGEFCNLPPGKCCCDIQGICIPIPGECPNVKEPVCGCDGLTYANDCEAHRAGVSIEHPGECVLCPATRVLADPEPAYCPGMPRSVHIMLTLHDGVTVVALEDSPPAGWIVHNISHEGTFDAVNGKVKWGPFFAPSIPAMVSYDVIPPPQEDGLKCFTGAISIDGFNRPVCGDECLERFCCPHMDADVPRPQCADCATGDCTTCRDEPCGNRRLTLCELIGYACAWMRGCNDDMAGMTRAAYIWRNGECYCWDDTTNNWYPVSCDDHSLGCCAGDSPMGEGVGGVAADIAGAGRATVLVPPKRASRYGKDKGFEVPITVEAPAGTSAVALECRLPEGWKVTRISDGGKWDAQHRKVKWGPFFDDLSRTFTFNVHRIRSTVRSDTRRSGGGELFDGFSGTVSFDGVNRPIVIE